jgi:hypothetical protein
LTHFTTITSKTSILNNEKELNQGNSKFVDNDFTRCKKGSFLHFKSYNLAIYVVKVFEIFSTHYFNCSKQDAIVEFQKKKIKYQFMQFALEVVILECSFPKP